MTLRALNRAHIFCSSFAFYDFEPLLCERAKEWFAYCVGIAEEIGHPFDEGSCFPNNTKYVLFRNCKRALEKNADKVECIELRTSAREDIGAYGEAYASFDNKRKEGFIGIHRDFINREKMLEVGIKLCEIIRPKYGVFYEIPFVYSPEFYAGGAMGLGELDTDEYEKYYNPKHVNFEQRATIWGWLNKKVHNVCSDGYLREIYPINFINNNHLNYEVFSKVNLKDWIEGDERRGTLRRITNELHVWIVEEKNLEDVAVSLAKSDICLCINKIEPHRYDYGVRLEDKIELIPWSKRKWYKVDKQEKEWKKKIHCRTFEEPYIDG